MLSRLPGRSCLLHRRQDQLTAYHPPVLAAHLITPALCQRAELAAQLLAPIREKGEFVAFCYTRNDNDPALFSISYHWQGVAIHRAPTVALRRENYRESSQQPLLVRIGESCYAQMSFRYLGDGAAFEPDSRCDPGSLLGAKSQGSQKTRPDAPAVLQPLSRVAAWPRSAGSGPQSHLHSQREAEARPT